jgi:hypothetical protein
LNIREKSKEFAITAVAVYWATSHKKFQMHFLAVLYEGYSGVSVVLESECEIIDPSLDGYSYFKNSNGQDMLIQNIALQDKLLDRLIEHEAEAMATYLKRRDSLA